MWAEGDYKKVYGRHMAWKTHKRGELCTKPMK